MTLSVSLLFALLLYAARQSGGWPLALSDDPETANSSGSQEGDQLEKEPRPKGWPGKKWFEQQAGTGLSEDEAEAPSSVSTLSGDELRTLGVHNVPNALRFIPGIDVIRTSATESSVSARGYGDTSTSAQGVLADRDGQSAYNDFFGGVFWNILPVNLDDVESIQMVRGPGSFLLGANAEHGSLSILTPSALDYADDSANESGSHSSFSVSSIHGERDSTLSALTQAWWDAGQGFKVTGMWDDVDTLEDDPDDVGDRTSMELRYTKIVEKNYRFELTGGVNEARIDILVPLFNFAPVHLLSDIRETSLKANFGPDDRAAEGFRGQLYWVGFESRSEEDESFPGFDIDHDTYDLDLRYSFKPTPNEKLRITTGFVNRYSQAEGGDLDVTDGTVHANVVSGLVQGELEVNDRLSLVGGFRLDDHSTAGLNGSPRLAAVWELSDLEFLRFSAGYGFRNPSLREQQFHLDLVRGGTGAFVVGNEDLEAEWMRSFEVGYYRRSKKAGHQVGATLFFNLIDDLIQFVDKGNGKIKPVNDLDERAYGVELEGRYFLKESLSVFGNYAYVQREDRDTGDRNPRAPRNKVNLGVQASPRDGKGLSATLWARFTDDVEFTERNGFDPPDFGKVDEYWLLNGQVSYPAGGGEVFLQGINMLDDEHREHPDGDEYGATWRIGFRTSF